MKLREYKNVHCIGIGGIGLSAIARYCHAHGAMVSGSDGHTSRITEDLTREGILFHQGHNGEHVGEAVDLVIYTIAVSDSNPELAFARKRGITCLTYPEALGMLTKEYTTIAVCGTHGKTTTTAMVASMLKACGKSPTVIVGSILSDGGTNFLQGDSEYLVVEACEYKRSFLNLHPSHVLVTNIDEDHLDYYKDLADIQSAFQEFVDKVPSDGSVITHHDVDLITSAQKIHADEIERGSIKLSVLGDHNKSNAQLALSLAKVLGLNEEDARKGLLAFTGTWRRMEYKGVWNDIVMYDDYGHHPTEIKATLQALREKYSHDKYKLIAVFQPHLFSRTKLLLQEFSESFVDADMTIVLPIYAAREQDDETISSEDLVEITTRSMFMESFEEIEKYVLSRPHYNTVLVTIGAGDVYYFHKGRGSVVE
jgi:UDP-N-acetylmuramate--alanine ligase